MGFFDYFDLCKTINTNATDVGVPFSTEPYPFCFDDPGMPSCSDDSPFGLNSFDTDSSYSDTFDYGSSPTTRILSPPIRSVRTTFEKGS